MKSAVSEKGQVTIPKVLRDRMGITPGQKVAFEEREDVILLRPVVTEDPLRRLVGLIQEPLDTDAYLAETRGPAWTPSLDGEED
jgi:AbrB family looped-hinge helix DNA binding protein